jgi:hypothetical protein
VGGRKVRAIVGNLVVCVAADFAHLGSPDAAEPQPLKDEQEMRPLTGIGPCQPRPAGRRHEDAALLGHQAYQPDRRRAFLPRPRRLRVLVGQTPRSGLSSFSQYPGARSYLNGTNC